MSNLKFAGFTFPHNPSTFQMSYDNRVVTHEFPEINRGQNEILGMSPRTFSGSGIFYGVGAWWQFSQLSETLWSNTRGILEHPNYGKFDVVLKKLVSKEEPLPNFVAYDFEFIEHSEIGALSQINSPSGGSGGGSSPSDSSTRYYTTVSGDNLWKISKKYYGRGSDWRKIADANKSLIKNPDIIYPGWKLLIP